MEILQFSKGYFTESESSESVSGGRVSMDTRIEWLHDLKRVVRKCKIAQLSINEAHLRLAYFAAWLFINTDAIESK